MLVLYRCKNKRGRINKANNGKNIKSYSLKKIRRHRSSLLLSNMVILLYFALL